MKIVGKSCSYANMGNIHKNQISKKNNQDDMKDHDHVVHAKKYAVRENFNRNNYHVPVYSNDGYDALVSKANCVGYSTLQNAYGKPCGM